MFSRLIRPALHQFLTEARVVLVHGPRQAGKTTLVRQLEREGYSYFSLDDQSVREAALLDPGGFVAGQAKMVIDEVQRAPQLLPAIKHEVDLHPTRGRFVLTGSANVMQLPSVSESLAGRKLELELLPLAQVEIEGSKGDFLPALFDATIHQHSSGPAPRGGRKQDAITRALTGGFPEARLKHDESARVRWLRQYAKDIVARDLRDVAKVHRLGTGSRFLKALAGHNGQVINLSKLGGAIDLDHKTVGSYIDLLEAIYLVARLPAYHRNFLKTLSKSPKLHFIDTGLFAAMRGLTEKRVAQSPKLAGPLLETLVYTELRKQAAKHRELISSISHFRDQQQREVDFVLESWDERVCGIEVKAAKDVKRDDFKGLQTLQSQVGDDFASGVLLYTGDKVLRFGEGLFAMPIQQLWQ